MSSVSVVTNSLLIRSYRPRKINWLSMAAPAIMAIAFTALFIEFARFSAGRMESTAAPASVTQASRPIAQARQ